MSETQQTDNATHEPGYFYSVLNLTRAASQAEINERHRALSLIFHPDKQLDPKSKDVATRKFLEIQKAYQILSDSFFRTLGEEGLALKWNDSMRRLPKEEKWRDRIHPRGRLECTLDASSLFGPYPGTAQDSFPVSIANRMADVRLVACNLRHSVQRQLGSKTLLAFTTRVSKHEKNAGVQFMGTVRHQFSPRLASEISASLLAPQILKLSADYQDEDNTVSFKTSWTPLTPTLTPAASLTLSRRLFPRRYERGVLSLHAGRHPQIAFNILLPSPFNFGPSDTFARENAPPGSVPPSISGLSYATVHKSLGFSFTSIFPKLMGEAGITLTELSLQIKTGFELGLEGLTLLFTGSWSNDSVEISASTIMNPMGVVLKLDFSYLEQRLALPIVLSQHYNPIIALCTVVIPSTTMVVGYHFVLKPRRRSQRLAHIRAARQAGEEDSGVQREKGAVVALLRDTAKRHMQTEKTKEGLLITEATYAPLEKDDRVSELSQDVTIPIQALVRNSQLHIPGDLPKVSFSDPAPFTSKVLRIRYLFNGRLHYAEIPDNVPVVLPLAEHLVE
ncbi:hypothetical protein AMATHDRAFT_77369 [Amanita thiersii Skay4041]|uniref:J domain-containing protein n=1 Tax=Amanita thiersii Skay4041 TaxID=703135 RepID=A0A2A9NAH5_9AGAR|nr:hypothetical protein AMATHDRAFT_77369 [Amanita thiersii Skay4041]